jgi:hypothetical protein
MGFFDGIWARFSPLRNIDSGNTIYGMSDGARVGSRRFFDPPSPFAYPQNRTSEILEVLAVNTSILPLPEDRSEEVKHGPWTSEDKRSFLLASLQSRYMLPPSQQSPDRLLESPENVARPTTMPQHQIMTSFPSVDGGTGVSLEKEAEEHQKRAWVEMVLDPNRFHRIRSSTPSSTQETSSRSSGNGMEKTSEMESRYSPMVPKIEIRTATSDSPTTLSPYLSNREAINRMLQQRSSPEKVKPLNKSLDDGADVEGDRNPPTSSDANSLQNISEEDLLKTRSVIRQFHSTLQSDSDTIGNVKSDVQSRGFLPNQRVALPQNREPMYTQRKESDRIPPKTIRMKLPIADSDADDDGIDAQENRNLSLRDAMQKASFTSSPESQEDRSKKWGIDMSKFT